jgi:NAD(P)H-dependent FMN reductase
MKVLVLNGSPRPNGSVATLLKCIVEGLAANRHEVEWVDVHALEIRECTGCMQCRPDGECVLPEDDAHRIGRKIQAADALVVGTPTHWANMTASLKSLFDRNVPVFMGERPCGLPQPRQKGKPAALVTACATPWPWNYLAGQSRGALRAVGEVLHRGGYRLLGSLVMSGTKRNPQVSSRLRAKAVALGRRF